MIGWRKQSLLTAVLACIPFIALAADAPLALYTPIYEDEVWDTAQFILRSRFTKCADGVFSKSTAIDQQSGNQVVRYCQYKRFRWGLRSEELTYLDILHGVEWRGAVEIEANQYRKSEHRRWGAWEKLPPMKFFVQKKNGFWNTCPTGSECALAEDGAAPTCEELDPLR